jgi:predicted SAM-dependent methyltransferase
MKLHLGCGTDLKDGFENRDIMIDGWTFQSGLPYPDDSVEAITISHALHILTSDEYEAFIKECYRVLKPGGVFRNTDDDTETPTSMRHKTPWYQAKTMTGPQQSTLALLRAGFQVYGCTNKTTYFTDDSLLIERRDLSYVYFIEGVKP